MDTEQNGTTPEQPVVPDNISIPADQLSLMQIRIVNREEVVNDRTQIIAVYTCVLVDSSGRMFSEATPQGNVPLTLRLMADTGRRTLSRTIRPVR